MKNDLLSSTIIALFRGVLTLITLLKQEEEQVPAQAPVAAAVQERIAGKKQKQQKERITGKKGEQPKSKVKESKAPAPRKSLRNNKTARQGT